MSAKDIAAKMIKQVEKTASKNIGGVEKVAAKAEPGIQVFSRENLPKKIKIGAQHLPEEEIGKELEYNYRLNGLPDIKYAVKDGKVIGHVGLDDEGAVKSLYVDPEHRRQGVAENMYKQIAEQNGSLKSDELMAMEPEAKNMWEKLKGQFPDSVKKTKDGYIFNKPDASKIAQSIARDPKAEAAKVIETLLPTGASDAQRAALRAQPDKYKQYLDALDAVHGPREVRAKDLGFDTKVYHGTDRELPAAFDPAKSEYVYPAFVTKDPRTAEYFAQRKTVQVGQGSSDPQVHELLLRGKPKDPLKALEKHKFVGENGDYNYDPRNSWQVIEQPNVKKALDSEGISNPYVTEQVESEGYPGWINEEEMSGRKRTSKNIAVGNVKDLRRPEAAFDPRFSGSADLLALTGSQAPKIAARMIKPRLNLGDAFSAITEPIAAIDKPVNDLVEQGADKFAQLTDLKRGTGAGNDEMYQPIAKSAFNNFVGSIAPTPSSIMLGKGGSLLKMAGSAPKIVEKMAIQGADNLATKKAEQAVSQFASPNLDWTNLDHIPNELRPNMSTESAAAQYGTNKAKGKSVTVLDSKADQVGFGKVRVLP